MRPEQIWYEVLPDYIEAETTARHIDLMIDEPEAMWLGGGLTAEEEEALSFRTKMYTAWRHDHDPIWRCSDCGTTVKPKYGWVFFEYKDMRAGCARWRVGHFDCPERSYGSDYRDYGLESGFFNIGRQVGGKNIRMRGDWLEFIQALEWPE